MHISLTIAANNGSSKTTSSGGGDRLVLGLLIITLLVIVALSVALVVQTYTYNQDQAARDVSLLVWGVV